eukprot:c23598_g3_i1 orf=114-593(+)
MALASSLPFCGPTLSHGYTSQVRVFACKPATPAQPPRSRPRRRRRLRKEDAKSETHRGEHFWDPHLERQVRRIHEQGMHLNHDVERLKLQRENKFELILELAEEANNYLLNNPEEAIVKKPALKVISDMVNETGSGEVADAYLDATFEFLEDLGRFTMY